MTTQKKCLALVLCAAFIITATAWAADADPEKEKLAKETEAKAKETASTKPTTKMIIEKVTQAHKLLTEEGPDAYAKFKGKDSEFVFAGTYIWIHDMKGTMQMHPIKYKLEGKPLLGLKDKSGKLFFGEMNKVAREKGAGWVDYMWPKPGDKKPSKKVSYVKLCKMKDGQEVVIGCGVYDLPEEEVKKLTQK
jgi:signal transduction histidine kinase